MSVKLAEIVEKIKGLDIETKEYLSDLIKKLLIAERRNEIKRNAEAGLREYRKGKIKFGSLKDIKASLHAAEC